MSHRFWAQTDKPLFVLAPMADVTDAAFRRLIAKYSKLSDRGLGLGHSLGAMWTEFVSADGLARAPEEGRRKLMADLIFTEAERPIVAQFFTSNPENMERAAALAAELGFDAIDINMGCPDRSIEKQGAGAAMIKNPKRAKEVIAAAVKGGAGLPVSVKTRIGYNKDELEEWLPQLLDTDAVAITLHLRTRKEMSLVPARWERLTRAVEIRNKENPKTLILGNGDLHDIDDARSHVEERGADGAMLGRAIFGNPWLFAPKGYRKSDIPLQEQLRVMVEHTKLFEELFVEPASSGAKKSFAIMKKHYKAYVSGFDDAAALRAELMEAPDAVSVARITERFLSDRVLV